MSAVATDTDWQATALAIREHGEDVTVAVRVAAEATGKHPATIRKLYARTPVATNGHATVDAETAARLREAAGMAPIPGQQTIEGDEVPSHAELDDGAGDMHPRFHMDDLADFKAEAGEPVGPMPPSRAVDPQDGLFDKVWEDQSLLAVLEAREVTRAAKLSATAAHKLKDDEAKAMLDGFELAVGEVARIGRFRIKKTMTNGNEVSFTTEPREQLRIGVDSD